MAKKKINIIVDTRENDPLLFSLYDEEIKTHRDKLDAGDYTLFAHDMPGDDDSIIIERKANCQELVNNLGKKWEQFKAEAELLSKYKHKVILVCGPDNFNYLYDRGFTRLHPNFIYKQLNYLWINYGIQTLFLPDRDTAENYIFRSFVEVIRKNYE
jgi:ERCC4-type nuclease